MAILSSRLGFRTLGPWGPSAYSLFEELVKRLVDSIRDYRASFYLGQRLSVLAIQRGNAASLLGTLPVTSVGEEFYNLIWLVKLFWFSLFKLIDVYNKKI